MPTLSHSRPNVLLVCVDQWRGDCLSIADHPVVHTPFLDQLALRGVRFTRAYSATPTCIPARAALLTGLSQRTHGRIGYQDGVPWRYRTTLAGEFARHGYQTQAIGKLHVHPPRARLGFQKVILHDGYLHHARRHHQPLERMDDYVRWLRRELGRRDADYFEHGVNCNSIVARPWDKPEYTHPTNFVTSRAVEFLHRRDRRRPFFLFASYHRPHPPYDPPAWAFQQYLDGPIPRPVVGDWVKLLEPHASARAPDCFAGRVPWPLVRRARAGYYGHMTHIDHQVNRLLETLSEADADNTVVCFVSDHGEMIGDHHLFRKGYAYEGSARVPLLLAGPRDLRIRAGAAPDAVVELRDIMPTLLDCAGLPVPRVVEGRSLLGIARGEARQCRTHLHGEHVIFGQSMQWLTDGREKFVWWSGTGREQLFDLVRDPGERRDLARRAAHARRVARWRRVLVRELAGREEGFTDGRRLIAGRPVHACLAHVRPGPGAMR